MMKMAQKKKQIAAAAKERTNMKIDEQFTKQNVKTIIDKEAAELERKKIADKRFDNLFISCMQMI